MGEAEAQDGLTIMMSPVQLAAVFEGMTLSQHSKTVNRLWGGAGLLFSAVQLVGGVGLFLTPEPTMVTKVGAAYWFFMAWTADRRQHDSYGAESKPRT